MTFVRFSRRAFLASGAALPFAVGRAAAEGGGLPVVATFSILGDMVARIGGERVRIRTLVGPGGDAHVFAPTPVDAAAVAEAGLVVMNGLGFEGWFDRLLEASGYEGPVVVATGGITPRLTGEAEAGHAEGHGEAGHDHAAHDDGHEAHDHDHDHDHQHDHGHDHAAHADHHAPGSPDPHAWQDARLALRYVETIAAGMSAADPAGTTVYQANAAAFAAEIEALDRDIRAAVAAIAPERRIVVTSHDAFGYFADAYGLRFVAPQGVSTDSEASARDVAALIRQIRAEGIRAVFVESISDPRLAEQIARETGAKVGGRLYSDALSPPDGPAASYIAMMRHNLAMLTAALQS
jgi:zinc/manganese transport system substrate-binding protein